MIDDGIMWETPTARTTPFSEKVYLEPTFYPWKEWFAWYPVKKILWDLESEHVKRQYNWVWLKKINRRMVIDDIGRPGTEGSWPHTKKYYEYATLLEILKYGH